jgi:hypothetical protein
MSKFHEKYTTETLKKAIHKKHPNIELISEYLGDNDSEITVKCAIHNEKWKTTPHRLSQQKHGCKKCYHEERKRIINEIQSKKFQKFLEENYKPLYDISKVNYKDNKTKVKLFCPIHGEFSLRPDKMINRLDGCPFCKESHLERETRIVLDKLGIEYEREKTFDWLANKIKMSIDFYLPQYNIAIECQGEQHIIERDNSLMNKTDKFKDKVYRDKLKLTQCKENNVETIYIFNKLHSANRLNEQFNHMYDDALFIEDIIKDNNILLNKIKARLIK